MSPSLYLIFITYRIILKLSHGGYCVNNYRNNNKKK